MWPDLHLIIRDRADALGVLTAMITPALLLSACGTFILSTSNRLARVVDRIRALAQSVEELSSPHREVELREERIFHGREEIKLQSRRLRMLQWALTLLYLAAVSFVCTSIAIGLVSTVKFFYFWVPVVAGVFGACCMLVAAVMLLVEARKAVRDLYEETEFHRRVTRLYATRRAEGQGGGGVH
jgi:hypothetical protein